jgi:hypothetical protein
LPFVVPNIPFAFGSRVGATALNGSLTPTQSGSVSRIGGSLTATPPFGVFAATCSWGFRVGPAPIGKTTLTVAASGTTFERGYSWTFGGYSSAIAEISTTIEELFSNRRTRRLELVRSVTSAPTSIFNLTNWAGGWQLHTRDGNAATLLIMPIRPKLIYRFWINSVQSASFSGGITGIGMTVSNFHFDMDPVFFSFS